MSFLTYLLAFVGGLSLLIVIHELGHYLPAKWFGMRVEKFYLFFDWPRKLFSWKRGETEYGVGVLPLGGYVKIAGMIDESMDTEHTQRPAEPWEFRAKPVWQRAIVMVGGVTMNVLLAIAIFSVYKYSTGEVRVRLADLPGGILVPDSTIGHDLGLRTGDRLLSYNGQPLRYLPSPTETQSTIIASNAYFEVERAGAPLRIDIPNNYLDRLSDLKCQGKPLEPLLFTAELPAYVALDSSEAGRNKPAAKAGLRTGDLVLAIDTVPVSDFISMRPLLEARKNQQVNVQVLRGRDTLRLPVQLDTTGMLGVALDQQRFADVQRYGLFGAIGAGTRTAFRTVADQIQGFGKIFRGEVSASKSVAGPLRIAGAFGDSIRVGVWPFLLLCATLSMILAFVNILPIPALDGGHLVFLLLEAVMRREPSLRLRMIAQQVGMVLILGLMGFILFNDALSAASC